MADIIYNGEVEKKCITDQFCENLAHMLKTDRDVVYLDGDLMFCYGQGVPSIRYLSAALMRIRR